MTKSTLSLFRDRRSYPLPMAQDCLSGLTHYVDDETLRYFKAKIVSCRIVDGGRLLAIVERLPCDSFDGPRRSRFVIFNIAGDVINSDERETEYRTTEQATKAMWAYLNGVDSLAVTREAILSHNKRLADSIIDNCSLLATIEKEGNV